MWSFLSSLSALRWSIRPADCSLSEGSSKDCMMERSWSDATYPLLSSSNCWKIWSIIWNIESYWLYCNLNNHWNVTLSLTSVNPPVLNSRESWYLSRLSLQERKFFNCVIFDISSHSLWFILSNLKH